MRVERELVPSEVTGAGPASACGGIKLDDTAAYRAAFARTDFVFKLLFSLIRAWPRASSCPYEPTFFQTIVAWITAWVAGLSPRTTAVMR